jgi:membrane associated rhomboid family serine protease
MRCIFKGVCIVQSKLAMQDHLRSELKVHVSFLHNNKTCSHLFAMARFNIPVLTRSLLILIVGLTTLNVLTFPAHNFSLFLFFGEVSRLIGIVPNESYRFPWTFLTATFVERNLFGLVLNSLTVFFGGRYLERAWGTTEYGKYILVISVIPNVITWLLYFVLP